MDFEWAADVLNMDLTGRDPGPLCAADQLRLVPNQDSDMEVEWDGETGHEWTVPPDAYDETTDTVRDRVLVIGFDTLTDLEARLAVLAIEGFVTRRTTLTDVAFTYYPAGN